MQPRSTFIHALAGAVVLQIACGEGSGPAGPADHAAPRDAATPDVVLPVPDARPTPDGAQAETGSGAAEAGAAEGVGTPGDASAPADAGVPDASPAVDDAARPDTSVDAPSCDALTWESFGEDFMFTYCVNCHSGAFASAAVDLETRDGVRAVAGAVRDEAVEDTRMPPAGATPTSTERALLGRWLECGLR